MQALIWIWFVVTWFFILAVILKDWRARERRDAERTERALQDTKNWWG